MNNEIIAKIRTVRDLLRDGRGISFQGRQNMACRLSEALEKLKADLHSRCDCDNPSGHVDSVDICCDCGGYRP